MYIYNNINVHDNTYKCTVRTEFNNEEIIQTYLYSHHVNLHHKLYIYYGIYIYI